VREKVKKFFEDSVDIWAERDAACRRRFVLEHLEEWLLAPDELLLDLGCGTGIASSALAESGYPPQKLILVDIAAGMLRTARKKLPDANFVESAAESLPIRTESVGRVLIFDAFPHMDTERTISEIRRVLRPGGEVIVLHDNCHYRLNQIHSAVGEPVAKHTLPPVRELSRRFAAAGFEVRKSLEIPKSAYFLRARKV